MCFNGAMNIFQRRFFHLKQERESQKSRESGRTGDGRSPQQDPPSSWRHPPHREEGPPDLDVLIGQWIARLTGKKKNKRGWPPPEAPQTPSPPLSWQGAPWMIGVILLVFFALWFASGIFIVAPAENAVVLRFGRYVDTLNPGIHWLPTFVNTHEILNVQRISTFHYEDEMLTKDENMVFVSLSVQYRIANARHFLYNVSTPERSLQQATASALRQVIGSTTLNAILTTGRAAVREEVLVQLNRIMSIYNTGLEITDINLQPARPPEEVTEAFDDAIKAREDKQRYINRARAYANRVFAIAQGRAKRKVREADAFKEQIILLAKADTEQYKALLVQYRQSPGVLRDRLYIDAVEHVFATTPKVLLDVKNGQSPLLYLPLSNLTRLLHSTTLKRGASQAGAPTNPRPLFQSSDHFSLGSVDAAKEEAHAIIDSATEADESTKSKSNGQEKTAAARDRPSYTRNNTHGDTRRALWLERRKSA